LGEALQSGDGGIIVISSKAVWGQYAGLLVRWAVLAAHQQTLGAFQSNRHWSHLRW
jgi:hypothetical protein